MMNPHEKLQAIKLLEQTLALVKSMPIATRCADCLNMRDGICRVAEAAPPPEVLETGCEFYKFDHNSPPF